MSRINVFTKELDVLYAKSDKQLKHFIDLYCDDNASYLRVLHQYLAERQGDSSWGDENEDMLYALCLMIASRSDTPEETYDELLELEMSCRLDTITNNNN